MKAGDLKVASMTALPSQTHSAITTLDSDAPVPPDTFSVLGVPISITSLDAAADAIRRWAKDDKARFVFVRDVNSLMETTKSPELMALHFQAAMVTPDGMPLVWLGKLAGKPVSRTCGPDLMARVLADSQQSGLRHYFYGGKPNVAELVRSKFAALFPATRVVGTGTPPFRSLTRDELASVAADINASGADVVWIGISSPKQEYLMRDLAPFVHATMIGVGAAFDFHAGAVRRAPKWMQGAGLEWLWRLSQEPGRLWKRYLIVAPLFCTRVALSAVRAKA